MGKIVLKLLKRGKAVTPYMSSVSTGGWVQRAFAMQIGIPVGQCVKANVTKGMTLTEIRKRVKSCAPAKGAVHLTRGA